MKKYSCFCLLFGLLLGGGLAAAENVSTPAAEPVFISIQTPVPAPTAEPSVPSAAPESTAVAEPAEVAAPEATAAAPLDSWEALLEKYRSDDAVGELVFVRYQGGSTAQVQLYIKKETGWEEALHCRGYVGYNGIDKQKEGDKRTPTGDFGILTAFGIKSNPGTVLPYIKVTSDLYCCADEEFYNKIVSKKEMHHKCTGEHLINYKPCYNYGLFLDYNSECEYGKGSAIFMHCFGSNKYTHGCVAVSEKNMKTILTALHEGARICIFPQ